MLTGFFTGSIPLDSEGRGDIPSLKPGRYSLIADASGRKIFVTWTPVGPAETMEGSANLILMRSPEPDLKTPMAAASSLYRLTPSETQVLHQIVSGRTLVETAQIIGVARSTAKTHLESVYAKVGVRRQADLIRRVTGLVSPTSA